MFNCVKTTKIIAKKGAHQVGQVISREQGELVTIVGIICANNNDLSLVLFFPRIRYDATRMMHGASDGTKGLAYPSGWSTSQNLLFFISFANNKS